MGTLEPIAHLRQVPLFSHLSEANLERVAAIAQPTTFPRGSHLATAGEPGTLYCYIASGEALVRAVQASGRLRPVAYLQAGDCFGVTSLLLGEPHDATVEATTDVEALVLHRDDFVPLLERVPGLADQLVLPDEIVTKLRHERFAWLDPDEVVVFFSRRHWFVFVQAMILPTLGALVLGGLFYLSLRILQCGSWVLPLGVSLLLYAFLALWHLVNWRNDYFIVTTQRVVHRELVILQYESRHEAPLDKVQDVTLRRDFLGNLFGFGNVLIQTAAQTGIGLITFDHLPDPEAARMTIFQQIRRSQARSQSAMEESVRQELKRRLQWATPEEVEARTQAHAHATAQVQRPPEVRDDWLSRLGRIRLLPPLRVEQDGRVVWRKHWLFLLRRTLAPALAIIVWIALLFSYLTGRLAFLPPGPGLGFLLGMIVAGLLIGFWLWWQTVDWENDIYVLTDDRIIDIERKPLFFAEERREANLDRIQNVNLTIPHPIAALLNYGNLNIDTAGAEGQFTFTRVMAPHEVQREIMSRVAQHREMRQRVESQRRRQEIADWFAAYEELRHERQPPEPGPEPGPAPPEADVPAPDE